MESIEILESVGIAWPNPLMWQGSQSASTSTASSDYITPHSHAHSPRRYDQWLNRNNQPSAPGAPFSNTSSRQDQFEACPSGTMFDTPQGNVSVPSGYLDYLSLLGRPAGTEFNAAPQPHTRLSRTYRTSNTDISMPDYVPSQRSNDNETACMYPYFSATNFAAEEGHQSGPTKVPTNSPNAAWGPSGTVKPICILLAVTMLMMFLGLTSSRCVNE